MFFIRFCLFYFHLFLYLIQIHISEPISTELCKRLSLRLEEVVGYVWTHNIWPFSTFSISSVRSQCRILGTTWLPAQESLRQRYIRDLEDDNCAKSHPRQPYIRDVADDTCALKCLPLWVMHRQRGEVNGMQLGKYGNLMGQEGSESWIATAIAFDSSGPRRGNVVVADDRVIRHGVVSLIPAGVRVTSRILRSTGRRGHPPQCYIPHSSFCFCNLQEITTLQTKVARSYFKCVALSVMRTIRWDVNGIHVSTIRNLIRRKEVTKELQLYE